MMKCVDMPGTPGVSQHNSLVPAFHRLGSLLKAIYLYPVFPRLPMIAYARMHCW
ncbi:unnamed protein product [Periconia digitata]|uniref:Uncharacterized protein n=1 Tax=Periconia digitata TaxID=1303443 RepID=A0A9W4U148_9PLEO|nr:unnamed protein product [Periconia digitata]